MKNNKFIFRFIVLLALGLVLNSCENEDLLLNENEVDLKSGRNALMLNPAGTCEYIMKIIPLIEELAESNYLNKGNSHSLIKKIENTVASIEKGNTNTANSQLKSFINQMEGFKAKGTIPLEHAKKIINQAGNGLLLIKGSFLDIRDGNEYKIVLMGDKIWMAENLKYLPYLSTMPADYPPDYEILNTENPGGLYYVYQYWGSSVEEAKMTYAYKTSGVLYSYGAAAGATSPSTWPVGASPSGWHVASNEEWDQLAQYVSDQKGPYIRTGGYIDILDGYYNNYIFIHWENVGTHLKSTTGWYENNGFDDFGFSAYPNGRISPKYNEFDGDNIPKCCSSWWTSTPMPPGANEGPICVYLTYRNNSLQADASNFSSVGLAVRCVKD